MVFTIYFIILRPRLSLSLLIGGYLIQILLWLPRPEKLTYLHFLNHKLTRSIFFPMWICHRPPALFRYNSPKASSFCGFLSESKWPPIKSETNWRLVSRGTARENMRRTTSCWHFWWSQARLRELLSALVWLEVWNDTTYARVPVASSYVPDFLTGVTPDSRFLFESGHLSTQTNKCC